MFIIETELGRFEGETERDAKRLLAVAKRKSSAENKRRQSLYNQALSIATTNAYRFYFNCLGRGETPPTWEPLRPIEDDSSPGNGEDVHIVAGGREVVVVTATDVTTYYEDPLPTHYVSNAAGCLAFMYRSVDSNGLSRDEFYAIGVCSNVLVKVPMPGIVRRMFTEKP